MCALKTSREACIVNGDNAVVTVLLQYVGIVEYEVEKKSTAKYSRTDVNSCRRGKETLIHDSHQNYIHKINLDLITRE